MMLKLWKLAIKACAAKLNLTDSSGFVLILVAGGRLALYAGNGFPSDPTCDYFGRSGCFTEQYCTAWEVLIVSPGSRS